MAHDQSQSAAATAIPSWIEVSLFEPVFKEIAPEFKQTKKFQVKPALNTGENYSTLMLRLEGEIELNDGSTKTIKLMLKTAHINKHLPHMIKNHNVFDVEDTMYFEVVPELEKLYRDVGVNVKFGANSYKLCTDQRYILLEDLEPKSFINVNRLEGLDMEHTHAALEKLAQWHAASAVHVATKGLYKKEICESIFKEETYEDIKAMFEGLAKIQLHCFKSLEGCELYYDRLCKTIDSRLDDFYDACNVDFNDFNVLNHGDCWSNNIMFKYDDNGKVKETYLVDYQMPKYGSPALDLYYFLLSSTKYELKIEQFDYFVNYYYNQLRKNLVLLNYTKKMPTLKDIHIMLFKYCPFALHTVTTVMAVALLDPYESANLDDFLGNTDFCVKLRMLMYSNARYRKHCEMLLPWLYYRGAI